MSEQPTWRPAWMRPDEDVPEVGSVTGVGMKSGIEAEVVEPEVGSGVEGRLILGGRD